MKEAMSRNQAHEQELSASWKEVRTMYIDALEQRPKSRLKALLHNRQQ